MINIIEDEITTYIRRIFFINNDKNIVIRRLLEDSTDDDNNPAISVVFREVREDGYWDGHTSLVDIRKDIYRRWLRKNKIKNIIEKWTTT